MTLTKQEIKILKKEWKAGNANALYKISQNYKVIGKLNKASKLLLKSANAGSAEAQYDLSINDIYEENIAKRCAKWCVKAAEQGHVLAMFDLAERYHYGWKCHGVSVNEKLAFHWYKLAAEKGHATAMGILGDYYAVGKIVKKDQFEAFKWYMLAAEKGNASAQNSVGNYYKDGEVVESDIQKAIYWYKKASANGDRYASDSLARLYEKGEGVEQNVRIAIEFYEKASKQGYEYALISLGNIYSYCDGFEADVEKAYFYYKKAARIERIRDDAQIYINGLLKKHPWLANKDKKEPDLAKFAAHLEKEYGSSNQKSNDDTYDMWIMHHIDVSNM